MKKYFLSFALLASAATAFAGGKADFWSRTAPTGTPRIAAEKYLTYRLQFEALTDVLWQAPQDARSAVELYLPLPDGSLQAFRVWETPLSSGTFYDKYPNLRTYTGVQKGRPETTVKIDVGEGAFHAMVLTGKESYFIDPFSAENDGTYLVYDRKDMDPAARERMRCELDAAGNLVPVPGDTGGSGLTTNGLVKRTYRLALACTGEYARAATNTLNPTKAQVLAKMITSINRVNGIYERELAVTLELIPNTDTLIFTDGTTDPYDNSNGSTMLGQNQTTVTAYIGSANYDIGHVFSTGGGGIASLGALCSNANKARGVTGSPNPVGDPFDVDYVAHEIGHQFGADHTFNAATGSCGRGNGTASSAYEPGSGSTIMAYAGICGSVDNIQARSDAYFHARSLDQITTKIASVATCGASATGSPLPVVAQISASYNIPWQTPFELEAAPVAGTAPTYCWEQHDLGSFGASYRLDLTAGPVWRTYMPDTSPVRVFPSLPRLLLNLPGLIGDKFPTVDRTTRFRLTVRDVQNGSGAFTIASNGIVVVNTITSADTFQITNLLLSTDTLAGGRPQLITWDTANTTASPINCNAVNIYYSLDSGRTWPYILATGVPNTGSATVTIPNISTVKGRIKVKAANNIFFALNRALLRTAFDPASVKNVSGGEKQVKIYPVPAKELITLEIPADIPFTEAVLFNNMGQQIWKGRFERGANMFPVANYPAGVYYFRLQNVGKAFAETVPFVVR